MKEMNQTDLERLMHAVLDGEASAGETRELERLLAADPAARARYQGLERLFGELRRVPQVRPPAGLADAVLQRIVRRPQRPGRLRQLLSRSRVFGLESVQSGRGAPGNSTWTHRVSRPGQSSGGEKMSEQANSSIGNRKIWIGTGVAAAAVVFGVYFSSDFPTSKEATSGTIAPAQRFRAEQPTAGDVKLGNQAGGTSSQVNPATQAGNQAASQAAGQAANQAAGQAAGQAANQAAGQAAGQAANQAAGQAAGQAANQAAGQAAGQAANQAAGQAAGQAANQAAGQAAGQAANQAAGQAASKAASQAAGQAANQAAGQAANQAASQAAGQAANQAASQAAGQAANRAASQAASQAGKN
jgi:hypothetical protein